MCTTQLSCGKAQPVLCYQLCLNHDLLRVSLALVFCKYASSKQMLPKKQDKHYDSLPKPKGACYVFK
jgi:hypothetical protein